PFSNQSRRCGACISPGQRQIVAAGGYRPAAATRGGDPVISFARLSIPRKIVAITMIITAAALLLASAAMIGYDYIAAHRALRSSTDRKSTRLNSSHEWSS